MENLYQVELINGFPHFIYGNRPIDIKMIDGEVILLIHGSPIVMESCSLARLDKKPIYGENVTVTRVRYALNEVTYVNITRQPIAYLTSYGQVIILPPSGISCYPGWQEPGVCYVATEDVAKQAVDEGRGDVDTPDLGASLETGAIRDLRDRPALVRFLRDSVI